MKYHESKYRKFQYLDGQDEISFCQFKHIVVSYMPYVFSALPKHEQKNTSYPCSRKPHGCKCLLQSQMTPQEEAVCRILPKQFFIIYMYIVFSFKHNICLCRPDMRLPSYSSAFFSYSSTFEPSPDNRYVHF